MAIPDTNETLDALLQLLSDGEPRDNQDMLEHLHKKFNMTYYERKKETSSGVVIIKNRRSWARTSLKGAGFIEELPDKRVRITEAGREQLASGKPVTAADLKNTIDWIDDALTASADRLRDKLYETVLDNLRQDDPQEFADIVTKLLEKMKYNADELAGAPRESAGADIVDGVVATDALGLEKTYVQARKQDGAIEPSTIRDFVGSMSAREADKGVFITTADLTEEVREFMTDASNARVVLIDGDRLVRLMYDYGVGFVARDDIVLKKIDPAYFS